MPVTLVTTAIDQQVSNRAALRALRGPGTRHLELTAEAQVPHDMWQGASDALSRLLLGQLTRDPTSARRLKAKGLVVEE
jgi:hypothetical protein